MDREQFDAAVAENPAALCIVILPDGQYRIYDKGHHATVVGLSQLLSNHLRVCHDAYLRAALKPEFAEGYAEGAGDAQ